jgi:ParB/RepB/Spo0J family partition protein
MATKNELIVTNEAVGPTQNDEPNGSGAEPHSNGKASSSAAKPPPKGKGTKRQKPKPARKTATVAGQLRWEANSIPPGDLIVEKEDRTEPDPTDEKAQEKKKRLLGSISAYGIVEPIVVRRHRKAKKYVVIAGRRRLRAALELGLKDVPCRVLVSDCDDVQETEISMLENAEREGLTPYEWALKFKALSDATGEKTAATTVYDVTKGTISEDLLLLDDEVHQFLDPQQFQLLQRGQISAKVVSRNVRKLKKVQGKPAYEATLAATKAAMNGAKTKEFHTYKDFTFDDEFTGLSLQTKGRVEKAPSTRDLVESLKRWVMKLEEEGQGETQTESPGTGTPNGELADR